MNDLVQTVAQKTGVSAETVQKVLHSAVEHLRGHLPPQFAGMVDQFLGGQGGGQAGQGGASGLGGALGGMFGGGKS